MNNLEDIVNSCVIEKKDDIIDYTLDEAVEESIKEMESNETLRKQFKEIDMQVSNNQLYKSILDINESMIKSKREELIIDNKIFREIEKGNDIAQEINRKYNKTTFAIMIILFILGILIGMIDDKWIPYVGNILDFARTATNVVKG